MQAHFDAGLGFSAVEGLIQDDRLRVAEGLWNVVTFPIGRTLATEKQPARRHPVSLNAQDSETATPSDGRPRPRTWPCSR
jgi:hypothetical protein